MASTTAPARASGRGRQPASVERERDLILELRAAGLDMRAAGFALQYADRVGRRDLMLQTAARLVAHGERLARS